MMKNLIINNYANEEKTLDESLTFHNHFMQW